MAAVFHFPPSELWALDAGEVAMWMTQARRVTETGDEA